jgi:hypothetical protein
MPAEAWSDAQNVRMRDGYVEKFLGHTAAITPSITPYWALPARTASSAFWLYAGLTAVYATDMSTHADITRAAGGAYGATVDGNWNGGVLNGIPVINNGVDDPQMWTPVSLAQKLQKLSNWPANTTCKIIRPYKYFLVALDVTVSGTRNPRLVRWSSLADPGTVPATWDYTDPTQEAGQVELAQTMGNIVDCLPLRDDNIIYKDDMVIRMQYVPGSTDIFRFGDIFQEVGILGQACATTVAKGYHAVLTGDDFIRHDGQTAESLIDKRLRRWLQTQLSSTYYYRSFVVSNFAAREVWCCLVPVGQTFATLALVWNWNDDTLGVRELPAIRYGAAGVTGAGVVTGWAGDSDTWNGDSSAWDDSPYKPSVKDIMLVCPSPNGLYKVDYSAQFLGTNMQAYVERTGIGIPATEGSPPDLFSKKFLRGVWPRISGTAGGSINVYLGTQDTVDGAVTWSSPVAFTIGSGKHIDCRLSGRLFGIRFESTTNINWRLLGYTMDLEFLSKGV